MISYANSRGTKENSLLTNIFKIWKKSEKKSQHYRFHVWISHLLHLFWLFDIKHSPHLIWILLNVISIQTLYFLQISDENEKNVMTNDMEIERAGADVECGVVDIQRRQWGLGKVQSFILLRLDIIGSGWQANRRTIGKDAWF